MYTAKSEPKTLVFWHFLAFKIQFYYICSSSFQGIFFCCTNPQYSKDILYIFYLLFFGAEKNILSSSAWLINMMTILIISLSRLLYNIWVFTRTLDLVFCLDNRTFYIFIKDSKILSTLITESSKNVEFCQKTRSNVGIVLEVHI